MMKWNPQLLKKYEEGSVVANGDYIDFNFLKTTPSGKTKIYSVTAKDVGNTILGTVSWFGRWRKYTFWPMEDTVYEENCLRTIAEFCETITKDHK